MPNIGKVLEKKLTRVGIYSPAELIEIGSISAFQRILTIDQNIGINMLYALEGAIRNVRWHILGKSIKQELLYYYRIIKNQDK